MPVAAGHGHLSRLHLYMVVISSATNHPSIHQPTPTPPTHTPVPDLTVSVAGVPSRCQLQPDTGPCRAHSPQWFYNVTSQQCQVFVYGLCGGNDNRFHTPQDCYRQCKALSG